MLTCNYIFVSFRRQEKNREKRTVSKKLTIRKMCKCAHRSWVAVTGRKWVGIIGGGR